MRHSSKSTLALFLVGAVSPLVSCGDVVHPSSPNTTTGHDALLPRQGGATGVQMRIGLAAAQPACYTPAHVYSVSTRFVGAVNAVPVLWTSQVNSTTSGRISGFLSTINGSS